MLATLRKYPYPYTSALAFVTDIDTSTFQSLPYVHRCFYGEEAGYEGISLELSNSFWLMNTQKTDGNVVKNNFIYTLKPNGKERPFVRRRLAKYFKTALFDTMHTYGQFRNGMFKREHAEKCLEFAAQNDIHPKLWTYHGSRNQYQNIRPTDDSWTGDDPESDAYHLDLLLQSGMRYFRVPPSLDLMTPGIRKTVMETRDGNKIQTYAGHGVLNTPDNFEEIETWIKTLESEGKLPYEYRRIFQPSERFPHKVLTWKVEMLPFQLSEAVLEKLSKSGKSLFVNQHLTQHFSTYCFAYKSIQDALRRLDRYQKDGKILVSSPARLLEFELIRDNLVFNTKLNADVLHIDILPKFETEALSFTLDEGNLEGLAFHLPDAAKSCVVSLGGKEITTEMKTDPQGKRLASVPWRSLVAEQSDAVNAFKDEFGDSNE